MYVICYGKGIRGHLRGGGGGVGGGGGGRVLLVVLLVRCWWLASGSWFFVKDYVCAYSPAAE